VKADTADAEVTTPDIPHRPQDPPLELAWRCHRQWSLAAEAAKPRLNNWRKGNLALLVIGALAGAAAATGWGGTGGTRASATGATLALALAGLIQANALNADQTARWTRARAASEALKAEVFRYLVRVDPYAGPDRSAVLKAQLAVVQSRANPAQLVDQQNTKSDSSPLPTLRSIAEYVTLRAQHQADWHREQIGVQAGRGRTLRIFQLAATGMGVTFSALTTAVPSWQLSIWTAAATTIAAAIGAQVSATRYQRVAEAYAVTTDQLDRLIAGFDPTVATPDEQTLFVTEVERVLANQNNGWTDLLSAAPATGKAEPPAGATEPPAGTDDPPAGTGEPPVTG